MNRSVLKLTVTSVLICWVLGFIALALYVRSRTWTEEMARADGVLLAYQVLDETPAPERAERLRSLRGNLAVDLNLVSLTEVQQTAEHLEGPPRPGSRISHQDNPRSQWLFVVFEDGSGALAAGPVDPVSPVGLLPVGLILAILGVPAIAAFIALRFERELAKVERASQALAGGELSARVDNRDGPSAELAASFNAMAERVERLIRSRDELVQAVSHELGSPLSRLRFQLELLESQTDEERPSRISSMSRELDALDELVAELLGYVQSDELQLDPRSFDPHQGLADLAELARLEAPEARPVDIDVTLPDTAEVFADPRLFQRAVENILRNAVQHAHARVNLELTVDDGHVCVAVHDDGPGIPEELHEKVMVPFFRPDTARARKTGGVGLGLAIVRRIAQRHGGRVAIERSPLGGAKVLTWWPKEARS